MQRTKGYASSSPRKCHRHLILSAAAGPCQPFFETGEFATIGVRKNRHILRETGAKEAIIRKKSLPPLLPRQRFKRAAVFRREAVVVARHAEAEEDLQTSGNGHGEEHPGEAVVDHAVNN